MTNDLHGQRSMTFGQLGMFHLAMYFSGDESEPSIKDYQRML